MKLTTTTVRSLALPVGVREKTFFDDEVPGFGVRIRAGGSRTFVVQYKIGGKHRRMPLGQVSALDLSKARATAKDLLAAVRLGRDVAGEKLEQRAKLAETFAAFLPRYLTWQRGRLKPRSYEEVERHLLTHAKPFHGRSIEHIDRRGIAARIAEIAERSGPGAANGVRRSLSAYFAWLLREGLLEANPVVNTNSASTLTARERVLDDAELVAIWRALEDDQYGAIVRLLILVGARRDEIASLRFSEIDLDAAVITLPPERTKNRREQQIPLAPAALAILQAQPRRMQPDGTPRDLVFGFGTRGFQDWSGSKKDLITRIEAAGQPIADWRLHDFRRSMSTTMHERLSVQPHVVEAVLGHVSGHLAGVSGVYNRASYADLKRFALEKWAGHIEALVTGKRSSAAVVKLRRRRA
jgi:integrase